MGIGVMLFSVLAKLETMFIMDGSGCCFKGEGPWPMFERLSLQLFSSIMGELLPLSFIIGVKIPCERKVEDASADSDGNSPECFLIRFDLKLLTSGVLSVCLDMREKS